MIDLHFVQPDGHEHAVSGSGDGTGHVPLFAGCPGSRTTLAAGFPGAGDAGRGEQDVMTDWPDDAGEMDPCMRPVTPLSDLLDRPLAATLKAIIEDEAAIPHHREIALRTLLRLERVQADADADAGTRLAPQPEQPKPLQCCAGKPAPTDG